MRGKGPETAPGFGGEGGGRKRKGTGKKEDFGFYGETRKGKSEESP